MKKEIEKAKELINNADAIIVGIGSGMSSAAGYNHYHWNDETKDFFQPFIDHYGLKSLFDGFYYLYTKPSQQWAFYATYIHWMYHVPAGKVYYDLHELLKDKNYFILSTNVDMQLDKIFPRNKICNYQGSFQYFQCAQPCHDEIYDNYDMIEKMYESIVDFEVDEDLIPRCPLCYRQMVSWVQDNTFLQGKDFKESVSKYETFVRRNQDKNIVLLELGVGDMTPTIIKFPFWHILKEKENSFLISVNLKESDLPEFLKHKNLHLQLNIEDFFK